MYSFIEYSADIEQTRKIGNPGINTPAYNCLGLIGEVGEVVQEVLSTLPESQNESDAKVIEILLEFLALSGRVQDLKKELRKTQVTVLSLSGSFVTTEGFIEELGGVLWYLDSLANNYKTSLATAAYKNQQLLKERFQSNPKWMIEGKNPSPD